MIQLNGRTLDRRARELKTAAARNGGSDRGLLLFYAAECGLKSVYMQKNSLRDTAATNAAGKRAASGFSHRLDELIIALKVSASTLSPRPSKLTLKSGAGLNVDQLHQAWRYGAVVDDEESVIAWLSSVVEYSIKELL